MRGQCGGAIDRELLKWKKDKEDISSRMHTLSIIAEAAASLHMCAQVQSSIERPLHVHIQRGSRSMCGKQHMSNHLCHIDMHLITSSAARHHNMSARKKKRLQLIVRTLYTKRVRIAESFGCGSPTRSTTRPVYSS